MDRRKELKEQYKRMKPDMGVLAIKSKTGSGYYIEAARNLKGAINRNTFQLGTGSHPNRELQKEWKERGEDGFIIEILENLEYDKDESKTDYSEELELLMMIWEEKLVGENMKAYEK
jgi:hypothetical protein